MLHTQNTGPRSRQWGSNEAPAFLPRDTFAPPSSKIWQCTWLNFSIIPLSKCCVLWDFSKILTVNAMSVLVLHFLGKFSSFLYLQKHLGRSEKKLPQELRNTCHVGSNFSSKPLGSIPWVNKLSQTIYRTKLGTILSNLQLTILNPNCSGKSLVLLVSPLVWYDVNMLTFHMY